VPHFVFILLSVLWSNRQTVAHFIFSPNPRNHHDDFETQIIAADFEAQTRKSEATGFEAKPGETVATGFEAKSRETVLMVLRS
jgi:hypothetical protein